MGADKPFGQASNVKMGRKKVGEDKPSGQASNVKVGSTHYCALNWLKMGKNVPYGTQNVKKYIIRKNIFFWKNLENFVKI